MSVKAGFGGSGVGTMPRNPESEPAATGAFAAAPGPGCEPPQPASRKAVQAASSTAAPLPVSVVG